MGALELRDATGIPLEDLPVFRPVPELRALYRPNDLHRARQIITYCRTGGQAAHSYFTLKYLGYQPRTCIRQHPQGRRPIRTTYCSTTVCGTPT